MKTLTILALVLASSLVSADQPVRRIKIRHADPYLVMSLLSGKYLSQPEHSVLKGGNGGFGNSRLGGGQ